MSPLFRFFRKVDKGHSFVCEFLVSKSGSLHFFDDGDRFFITCEEMRQWYSVYISTMMLAKKCGYLVSDNESE